MGHDTYGSKVIAVATAVAAAVGDVIMLIVARLRRLNSSPAGDGGLERKP